MWTDRLDNGSMMITACRPIISQRETVSAIEVDKQGTASGPHAAGFLYRCVSQVNADPAGVALNQDTRLPHTARPP